MMQNNSFDDQARMTDLLTTEKHMTSAYNTFLCECETTEVMNCLSGILNDEHAIKNELFESMSSHGWYKTQKAEDAKISAAKQQFAQKVSV